MLPRIQRSRFRDMRHEQREADRARVMRSGLAIRAAVHDDLAALARLLQDYMRETFHSVWHGSVAALERDGFGFKFEMQVALSRQGQVIGFVAWKESYDLHHCIAGADILDLYVVPAWRGQGIAVLLICEVAAAVQSRGGKYLQGSGPEKGVPRRLYERVAMSFPGIACFVGGRAFRRLAELKGVSPRVASARLPEKFWNDEP